MIAVRVVKMVGDAIVDVVTVRHRVMAAARTVHMAHLMSTATMVGSAVIGVLARYLDHMLVDMILVRVVEVTVVQIVYVTPRGARRDVRTPAHADEHDRDGSGQSRWSWDGILSVSKIRGHRGAALGRVVNSVADQRQHVLVGERVENVLGLASPPDQANDGQGLQSRGDGADLFSLVFGQFRHTRFDLGKPQ